MALKWPTSKEQSKKSMGFGNLLELSSSPSYTTSCQCDLGQVTSPLCKHHLLYRLLGNRKCIKCLKPCLGHSQALSNGYRYCTLHFSSRWSPLWCFISTDSGPSLYLFPGAAVTNHLKLSGFKQWKWIISLSWRSQD